MATYVALLRGVNLGARNKVSMPKLRSLCERLGHTDVQTYVQSGNLVLSTKGGKAKAIADELEQGVRKEFGVAAAVLLRTPAQLRKAVAGNPFSEEESDPTKLLVVFLDAAPSDRARRQLDPDRSPPDRFSVRGREIYLHLPDGFHRSKLTIDYFEKRLGVRATARNWRTVTKLLALAE